jgi:sigma-B regulation protein RsbU (phosphoserine phosphatase)
MRHRLLAVDDERLNLMILREILSARGFDVDCCASGEEAVELVKKNDYTLVLLDILLPEMDGYSCCPLIKSLSPGTSVIMLTGMLDDDAIEKSFKSGASDYLKKPINETELAARVDNVIKMKEAEASVSSLNSKLLADLDAAHRVQMFMAPDWLIEEGGLVVSSIYEPALKVSGDILDFIKVSDDVYVIYAGDISGHGVQAALLMTVVQAIVKMLVMDEVGAVSPSRVLTKLNKILKAEFFETNYLTISLGILNLKDESFKYCEAGHPPLIRLDMRTGMASAVKSPGSIPVGWMPDTEYSAADERVIKLEKDHLYFLYTDGIFECADSKGDTLEIDGLRGIIERSFSRDLLHVYPCVLRESIRGGGFSLGGDDITVLTFSLCGSSPDSKKVFLTVSADIQEVSQIGRRLEDTVIEWLGDCELGAAVELIVNELLNNILTHGRGADFHRLKSDIFIEMTCPDGGGPVIKFWDKGPEWTPGEIGDHEKFFQDSNERRSESGRGLGIIKSLSCDFSVKRFSDVNETVVTLKGVKS